MHWQSRDRLVAFPNQSLFIIVIISCCGNSDAIFCQRCLLCQKDIVATLLLIIFSDHSVLSTGHTSSRCPSPPKSTKAIGLLPTINACLGCTVQHTVYIAKCKTQPNSLQHALCNTLFTDPVPHAHSYVEVQYMAVESSSDDFKAGYCKVGFKTLLRPQDSHGLDNTNTCLIVDDNIFWFRICV